MKCKIIVRGENSAKFKELAQKFGQVNALELIYGSDGSASIEGYTSDVEIADRVNGIAFSVFNHLQLNSGALEALDLTNDDLQARHVEKALDGAYMDLEKITNDALNDYTAGNNVDENAKIARKALVALRTFEQLVPRIKQRLESFGLTLNEANNDLEAIYKEEVNSETSKDKIYSQSNLENSRLDSVAPSVKLYLSTLPKFKTVVDTNGMSRTETVLDDLGMEVPNDFGDTFSTLSKSLANLPTFESMLDKLRDLSTINPIVLEIYNNLISKSIGKSSVFEFNGKEVHNFENAFFNAFKNTSHSFSTVVLNEVKDAETEQTSTQASVINSNKRALGNVIRKAWIQANSKLLSIPLLKKREIWKAKNSYDESMAEFFDSRSGNAVLLDNKRDTEVLVRLAKHLELTGISMSIKALDHLRREFSKRGDSFSGFIMTNAVSVKTMLKKFWQEDENSLDGEGKTLRQLYKAEEVVSNDKTGGAFMNGEGNLVHPINLPTAATELFDELISGGDRLEQFSNDPLMGNFKLLREIKQDSTRDDIQMDLFDTIYRDKSGEGIPYSSLDPVSAMTARLCLFRNYDAKGNPSGTHSWLMVPTPADRSGTRIVKSTRLKDTQWSGSGLLDGDFKDWLKDVTYSEHDRIQIVRSEVEAARRSGDYSKLIENYHYTGDLKGDWDLGNGAYFNNYPELNQFLDSDTDFDLDDKTVYSVLEKSVERQIRADIDYLVDMGVVNPTSTYRDLKPTKLAAELMPHGIVNDRNIYSFISNSIVVNHELSTIFTGDIAFFKGTNYNSEEVSQNKQLSDANKRSGLADTPGSKLRIGESGANPTFKVAFIEDLTFSSEMVGQYTKIIGEDYAERYAKLEVTDGQGFVSLDRYADILSGLGKLTKSMANTITELKKDPKDINWDNVTEVLQPLKGFLQGQRMDSTFGRVMPKNLKYSLLPVIPSAVKGNSLMEKISDIMYLEGADEVVFNSGSKYGVYNSNSLDQITPTKFVVMSNEDWRMPQVVPYKTKTKENMGTQLRKLIMGNINMGADYNGKSGEQLQSDYQKAISLKLQNGFSKLVNRISDGTGISKKKIANLVSKDLMKNSYKATPDFMEQALTYVDAIGDTLIPMSFPAIKHRVESSINSLVRKAVTKQDLPGFAAVQYAAVGFGKESISFDESLKFVRGVDVNGNITTKTEDIVKVLPAEVRMSPQYFIQTLLKKEQTPEIQEIIKMLQSGDIDMSKFTPEMLEMVIYRIPTQGKNSALPIKIVGFTPEALGSTIVLPAEITTQSGADYDIDKVYVECKHFDFVDGMFIPYESDLVSLEGVDNTIVQTHYDVLTSPLHFSELITPNNSDTLDTLSKSMSEVYNSSTIDRKWSSLATQDDFRDKNQAGGVMIGVFSIANTAHALFQELGVKIKSRHSNEQAGDLETGVTINGREVTSLGMTYVGETSENPQGTGELISDNHIEAQTAAVDNAKNPVLGNLNLNTITANVYNFLIESGAGINYAVKLVNSPIIRELTRLTRTNESQMGPDGAFTSALNELAENTPGLDTDISKRDFDVSESTLDKSIKDFSKTGTFGQDSSAILKAFLTFRTYGQDLVRVLQALQTDNVGAHQSLAANVIHNENLAKVSGTRANEMFKSLYPSDSLEVIETISLDREKYKNHSMEAFEKYGLQGAIDIASTVIVDSKPVQKKVLKDFQNTIGGNLVESDVRLLMNDFYSYLYLNSNAYTGDVATSSAIADFLDSDTLADLLVGEDSLGKRVLSMQAQERIYSENDVQYTPNEFLKNLTVELLDKKTGYDLISFNNTISRALTSEQKTTLSNEFRRLLEDSETEKIGQDLILYSIGMEGFGRSVNSFGDYIHTSLYETITNENGVSLTDHFRNLLPEFDNIQNFDLDHFRITFLKNRLDQLKGIKDMGTRSKAKVTEFLKQNSKTKYFKVTRNGKSALALATPEMATPYTIIGDSLGYKHIQVEYLSGIPMSKQPAIVKARQARDLQDNNEC